MDTDDADYLLQIIQQTKFYVKRKATSVENTSTPSLNNAITLRDRMVTLFDQLEEASYTARQIWDDLYIQAEKETSRG